MIEPEMAFCDIYDDMQCAEDYVRYCCKFLLENCQGDLEFITKMIDKTAVERLQQVASTPFKRITYTEAIELLEKAVAEGKKFEYPVSRLFGIYHLLTSYKSTINSLGDRGSMSLSLCIS